MAWTVLEIGRMMDSIIDIKKFFRFLRFWNQFYETVSAKIY
jgi:hypothetical protein